MARAQSLLVDLTQSHQWMREAIEMVELALSESSPALDLTIRNRWQLSRIERKRRAIVDAVIEALPPDPAGAVDALAQQRRDTEAYLRDYVWKWSPEAMQADWAGYRAAFADKRARLAAMTDQEQQVLVPLLMEQGAQ
ncbi:hypothetical protein [Sphingomonas sp.]|uniref:hypothetical protein n=1 Tax=Sphingomonas sp. TaxID=28214 RepID=UPI001DCDC318|nr:hypothetical protein [Sphingomonas sp.]MBX9796824.1 hypothetical protein [Sphingomonas sp.]